MARTVLRVSRERSNSPQTSCSNCVPARYCAFVSFSGFHLQEFSIRSNHPKSCRTDTHVLTNKHLNIPFCDLSISGYSEKTADAALFTNLSRENPSCSAGIDGAVARYPPAVQCLHGAKRPRSETSWFAMESNRVRTDSAERPSVLGSIHRTANSQPVEHKLRQCSSR